jgi:nucleotide-binding universal stress UspA family protein
MMDAFVGEYMPEEFEAVARICRGNIYTGILEPAENVEADLITISSHHPTMSDFLLGPYAARVVRHAKTSVLVVGN